jgi:amidase
MQLNHLLNVNPMKTTCDLIHRLNPGATTSIVVKPGESFVAQVQNAFGKTFENLEEFAEFLSPENEDEKRSVNHPCTGPIEIETSGQNISLAITIEDIKLTRAFQCVSKSTGLLKDKFTDRACKEFDIGENNVLTMQGGDLVIHTQPKIGFIATMDDEERSPGRSCENGGNLDLNYLTKGSTIYLPVNDSRARILVGDLHACQGNGEVAGIAIESDGEVTLSVKVVDKINFPIIDNGKRIVIVGWGDTLEDCSRQATLNALTYLERIFPMCDWPEIDRYMFLSAEGNLVIGNSTGAVKTCALVLHKNRITNKYNLPIF